MDVAELEERISTCVDPGELAGLMGEYFGNYPLLFRTSHEALVKSLLASEKYTFVSEEYEGERRAMIHWHQGLIAVQTMDWIMPAKTTIGDEERQERDYGVTVLLHATQELKSGNTILDVLKAVPLDLIHYAKENRIPFCLPWMEPPIYYLE